MSQSNQSFSQPKSWDLSLYELHRTPQETITDDTEIAISPRSLHSELMCPICLDMLTDTMTTKECLHRFCHDCIITALRAGNKECPTCRKKLISKRSLRRDPNFDSLIKKIYPDRDEYEAHQEKVMEKLNQHTNQQALTNSIEEGLRLQAQNRLQRMLKQQRKAAEALAASTAVAIANEQPAIEETTEEETTNQLPPTIMPGNTDDSPSSTPSTQSAQSSRVSTPTPTSSKAVVLKRKRKESISSNTSNGDSISNMDSNIELMFYPHPDCPSKYAEQQLRYLKTTANATVGHLIKYLSVRLILQDTNTATAADGTDKENKNSDKDFDIFLLNGEDYTKIENQLSLGEIQDTHWKDNRPMEMYYHPKPS